MPGATADAVNDILRGVMEPGGFGAEHRHRQALGRQDRHQQRATWPVWFVGYTPTLATAAMVAGADPLGNWVTLNGQVVGGSYICEAFGSDRRRPDLGRRDGRGVPKLDYDGLHRPRPATRSPAC